jgi:hypothetical protein
MDGFEELAGICSGEGGWAPAPRGVSGAEGRAGRLMQNEDTVRSDPATVANKDAGVSRGYAGSEV